MKSRDNNIDELDFGILEHLQQDGRKSFTEISKDLGVSVATIRNRITKLIDEKTLRVIGRVDPFVIGFKLPAEIQLSVIPGHSIGDIAEVIKSYPEVSYLASISGDIDLQMDVMCRDTKHLSELIIRLRQIPGISKIKSSIILNIYKMAQADLKLVDPRYLGGDMDE